MTLNGRGPLNEPVKLWRPEEIRPERPSDGPLALLSSIGKLAWKYKFLLIAAVVIGMTAAGGYAISLPKTYTASASLLLEPRQMLGPGQEGALQPILDLNRAESELQIIRSERVLWQVFENQKLDNDPELYPAKAGLIGTELARLRSSIEATVGSILDGNSTKDLSAEEQRMTTDASQARQRRIAFDNFINRLNVRRIGQSYAIEISYSSTDPSRAASVANAVASGYILQSVEFKQAKAGSETLTGRLLSLTEQVRIATEAMKQGILPKEATPDADARVIGAALAPLGPSSPRISLIVALGAVLGGLAGMGAIAISTAMDRKIREASDLPQDIFTPCFAFIPRLGDHRAITMYPDSQARKRYAAEIRNLRTSIDISCSSVRRERNAIIALVGPTPGVGVSTVCLSLSQLISRSGRHVTLFQSSPEGDEPSGPSPASLAEAAVSDANADRLPFRDLDGVSVLPILSQDLHSNIFADFRHPRILRILDAARLKGDVILDLPALSTSRDALALAIHADAVVIVVKAGETTTDAVTIAQQQLQIAGANVIGAVINMVKA